MSHRELQSNLSHAGNAGIGSAVHHMGQALALAIETNRTLVVAPDVGYPYTDTDRYSPAIQAGHSCCLIDQQGLG